MRIFQLARVAAEAESLRVQARLQRLVTSLALGLIALIFLLCAFGFTHLGLWGLLRNQAGLSPQASAGILAVVDLAIAVALALRAVKAPPSRQEIDARVVRQRALDGMTSNAAMSTALLTTLLAVWRGRRRRG